MTTENSRLGSRIVSLVCAGRVSLAAIDGAWRGNAMRVFIELRCQKGPQFQKAGVAKARSRNAIKVFIGNLRVGR